MNDKLKRCTAAGLVAIMLLVGFFAEAHHHAMPVIGQTTSAHPGSPQPGKATGQQVSHDCLICQLSFVAVAAPLTFSSAILSTPQRLVNFDTVASPLFCSICTFLRRGPPVVPA
jgi:hypothetical protein